MISNCFFIKDKTMYVRVCIESILYLEAQGDYVSIHIKERRFVIRKTMQDFEKLLPMDKFSRIHRSFLVQNNAIETIEGNTLTVNGQNIPIGESHKKEFESKFIFL